MRRDGYIMVRCGECIQEFIQPKDPIYDSDEIYCSHKCRLIAVERKEYQRKNNLTEDDMFWRGLGYDRNPYKPKSKNLNYRSNSIGIIGLYIKNKIMGIFDFFKKKNNSDTEEIKKTNWVQARREKKRLEEDNQRIEKNKQLIASLSKNILENKDDPNKVKIMENVIEDYISKIKHTDISDSDPYIISEFEKLLDLVKRFK